VIGLVNVRHKSDPNVNSHVGESQKFSTSPSSLFSCMRCLILPINTMSLVDFATGMSWFLISIEGICVMIGNIMVVTTSRQC